MLTKEMIKEQQRQVLMMKPDKVPGTMYEMYLNDLANWFELIAMTWIKLMEELPHDQKTEHDTSSSD